jgi:hypothetical protein
LCNWHHGNILSSQGSEYGDVWNIDSCSLVEVTDVSAVFTASIIDDGGGTVTVIVAG